jgi:biopolymer transport protein ExbD
MGGVSTGGGKGGKRNVDQEINMVPFIDLLMVTISFLLITAVWSAMARLNVNAEVPSKSNKTPKEQTEPSAILNVYAKEADQTFKLEFQKGTRVETFAEVKMTENEGKYTELEDAVRRAFKVGKAEWGLHDDKFDLSWGDAEKKTHGAAGLNLCILHVDNALPYSQIVKIIDAIYIVDTKGVGTDTQGHQNEPIYRYVCLLPKPLCCGEPTSPGAQTSKDGSCKSAAALMPAFNVSFSMQ